MTHFFISYSKKDTRELALALDDALNAIDGISSWVDRELLPGPNWASQIEAQIDRCDYMIVLLSPDIHRHRQGEKQSFVINEIHYAQDTANKPIIPVMAISTSVPIVLAGAEYINFTAPTLTLDNLVAAILVGAKVNVPNQPNAGSELPVLTEFETRVQDGLKLARNFNKKHNNDWQPYVLLFQPQGIGFEMCLIPPGTFMMGANDGEENEKPIHLQTLSRPFWIARYPVTNAQWRAAVEGSNGEVPVPVWADWYKDSQRKFQPVVGVTWHQCLAFTNWLGDSWRLPAEAEWEFAARGVESLIYPWGNRFEPSFVIHQRSSDEGTADIGGRLTGASWVGAEDMSGNVLEWTNSRYYSPHHDHISHPAVDASWVVKGGAWSRQANDLRSAFRRDGDQNYGDRGQGLRLAKS